MSLDFFENVEDTDFGAMLEGEAGEIKSGFNPGEKVTGTVVEITSNSILVDVKSTSEGIIDRTQFEEDGELKVSIGDTVDAFFAGVINGEIILTSKMKSQDADRTELENAYNANIPVEGKVTGKNNAGLEVTIGGVRGFCPASQVDIAHIEDLSIYTGQTLTFMILEMSEFNMVLSRRRYLEGQREEKQAALKESLAEGDVVTGTVTKLMDFGAFVDIGGMDGLIPMGEIAWERVKDVSEFVKAGEKVDVKVLKIDWDKKRITLSLKEAGSNPWDGIEDEYRSGIAYKGTVTRLASFGAFVQLKPGVEGLIHISKLGQGRRLSHPREVVEDGQEIDVFVESIDLDKRRISLALDNAAPESDDDEGGQIFAVGQEVTGTVVEHRPFGAFVQLAPKTRGLLHVSELEAEGGGSRQALIQKACPLNKEITVRIKDVRDGKLSLALPGTEDRDNETRQMISDQKKESEGFGSLGSLFDKL